MSYRLVALVLTGASVFAAGLQPAAASHRSEPPDFQMRFASPLRLAGELDGQVRSRARAHYGIGASITVGSRIVAKPAVSDGTSSTRWHTLRVRLTAAQRKAIISAARNQQRRPRLNIRIGGVLAGHHHRSSRYGTFVIATR